VVTEITAVLGSATANQLFTGRLVMVTQKSNEFEEIAGNPSMTAKEY
jgi:hypothetical protein